jgi:hypothetical protein
MPGTGSDIGLGILRNGIRLGLAIVASLAIVGTPARANEASADLTRQHLYAGTLAAGETELAARVAADSTDREARYGLGFVRFARAVEHLGQNLYHYGLTPPKTLSLPILRFPVPYNPTPAPISYRDLRDLLATFGADLASAEVALQQVGDADISIVLDLARIRLDLRGDGKPTDDETLAAIIAHLAQIPRSPTAAVRPVEVKFDAGDAPWLAGYSHALMALCDFLLAHDFEETFNVSAHVFFPRSMAPAAVVLSQPWPRGFASMLPETTVFADMLALVHTVNWAVVEPERMRSTRQHLKAMVGLSRKSWQLILAETGDDREWIPNPRQIHVALGVQVREDQIDAWMAAVDEVDAMLDGRILVPHWRFAKGIDLKEFFENPRSFDLVMVMTGSGVVPFLRDGPVSSAERWNEITRAFQNNFFAYALWFN